MLGLLKLLRHRHLLRCRSGRLRRIRFVIISQDLCPAELGFSMIRNVATDDLERVRGFLEAHLDTSLFLLSNLAVFGPRLADHGNSGNYRLIEEAGRVVAVFCLTRRGNLLVQAAVGAAVAAPILAAA